MAGAHDTFAVAAGWRSLMDLLTDALVVVGIVAAIAVSVLYVYMADRMVSGR
jgi:hypothetical protein